MDVDEEFNVLSQFAVEEFDVYDSEDDEFAVNFNVPTRLIQQQPKKTSISTRLENSRIKL